MLPDLDCDVLVVGSGAGGMLAALRSHDLGLKTLLIEKADRYGGTTAVSGGGIWIPNNDAIAATDTKEAAMTYLRACTKGQVSETRLQAYVDTAPVMARYLMGELGVSYFSIPPYSDYCLDLPGASAGGRTMMPLPFDAKKLGDELFRQREPHPTHKVFGRMQVDLAEMGALIRRPKGWWRPAAKMFFAYWLDVPWRMRTNRDRRLTTGNALIGGLRLAMLKRQIPLLLNTGLDRLIRQGGRVTGAFVSRNGVRFSIYAGRGVVIATGGFEKNQTLREKYVAEAPTTDASLSPGQNNVGDGLLAGIEIGAETEFLDQVWWVPSMRVPAPAFNNADMRAGLFMERAFPHTICVNLQGRRFVNEAMSYNDFGHVMIQQGGHGQPAPPCWLIFDATARHRYPIGALQPSFVLPDKSLPPGWLDNVLYRANTIDALALKIGMDAADLAATISRFNGFAATGVDVDFARGSNAYDQFFGDPRNQPNTNLGAISTAPFYAIRIDLGDIGTKGGLKVDENANVLDSANRPIAGLYATGNVSGAVTAASYPGAGATLGPAMTFAYRAANHIARSSSNHPVE